MGEAREAQWVQLLQRNSLSLGLLGGPHTDWRFGFALCRRGGLGCCCRYCCCGGLGLRVQRGNQVRVACSHVQSQGGIEP